jgi:hypothetical protein
MERKEEFKVAGEDVVKVVKKIIAEGNVRRISIKNEAGETLVEFPLTLGVIGALIAPVLAAVGAIAALVTRCTIVVERTVPDEPPAAATSEESQPNYTGPTPPTSPAPKVE